MRHIIAIVLFFAVAAAFRIDAGYANIVIDDGAGFFAEDAMVIEDTEVMGDADSTGSTEGTEAADSTEGTEAADSENSGGTVVGANEGSSGDTGDSDTGDSSGGASLSDLLDESGNADVDDMLGGFDPNADYGGLGLLEETGPGVVTIHVVDTEGEYIDGLYITEDGFRTDILTESGEPCVIEDIPSGETVYGVYLTYSLDLESVELTKYEKLADGSLNAVSIPVPDANSPPPVVIAEDSTQWEIEIVLSRSNRILVNYYMVSPNDRFYYTSNFMPFDPSAEDSPGTNLLSTFAGSKVRVAVYVEMPSLPRMRSIKLVGDGFDAGAREATDAAPWTVETTRGDYSMENWTFADTSWQMTSLDADMSTGTGSSNGSGSRFCILTIPSAFEGARIRLSQIEITSEDGTVTTLLNEDPSDCVVTVVPQPHLQ